MENISIEYGHEKQCWLDGYDSYTRLFKRKRQIVFTVLFAVIAVLFVEQIVRDPQYGTGWFCLAICIFMLAVNLLTPHIEKKKIACALDNIKDDRYTITIYEDRFCVKTVPSGEEAEQIPETVTLLSDKTLRAVEKQGYYGLFSKTTFCIIPRSGLSEDENEALGRLVKSIEENRKK